MSPYSRIGARPNWWRVWVNGKAASPAIHLPGSSTASADRDGGTWNAGSPVCNGFNYRFEGLGVAAARGGSWHRFVQAHRPRGRHYRVTSSASSFVARLAEQGLVDDRDRRPDRDEILQAQDGLVRNPDAAVRTACPARDGVFVPWIPTIRRRANRSAWSRHSSLEANAPRIGAVGRYLAMM